MSNALSARLAKLETSMPARRSRRVLRILSGEGGADAVRELVEMEGFGAAAGDIVIHRVIVAPEGRSTSHILPYILSRSPDHVR